MNNILYKAIWNIPDENAKRGEEIKKYVLEFFERNLLLHGQTYELLSILNEMFSLTLSLIFRVIDPMQHMVDPLIGMKAVFEGNNERFYTLTETPDEVVQHYSYMHSEHGAITMQGWYERIEYMVRCLSGATLTGEHTETKLKIPKFDTPAELKMKLQLINCER